MDKETNPTVSKTLSRTLKLLEILSNSDSETRAKLLDSWGEREDIFCSLSEISKNIVNGNINLSSLSSDERHLIKEKYLDIIIGLSLKPKSKKQKKQLVVQVGDSLPIIIPLVVNLLGEAISRILAK